MDYNIQCQYLSLVEVLSVMTSIEFGPALSGSILTRPRMCGDSGVVAPEAELPPPDPDDRRVTARSL